MILATETFKMKQAIALTLVAAVLAAAAPAFAGHHIRHCVWHHHHRVCR
jgi:hypothetical protein